MPQKSYQECYDKNRFTLDADKAQYGAEDDSKEMLLAKNPAEIKEFVSCEETTASRIAEGGKEDWDITQLKICSTSDNSKQLLNEFTSETVDTSGCGELNVDHAAKDSEGLACSSQSVNENVTPENAEDGNDSKGDEPNDDDFSPKDLLRFAWQIARGMVNNVSLFFRVSLERRLIIHIRCAGNKSP